MVIEKFVEYHGGGTRRHGRKWGGGAIRGVGWKEDERNGIEFEDEIKIGGDGWGGKFDPWYGSKYYEDDIIPTPPPATVREPYQFIEHFSLTSSGKKHHKFPMELLALFILIIIIIIVFVMYSVKKSSK